MVGVNLSQNQTSVDNNVIDVSKITDNELSNPDVVKKIHERIDILSKVSNLTQAQATELKDLTNLWFNKIHLKNVDIINNGFKEKHKVQEDIVSSFIAKNSSESAKNEFTELKKKLERITGRKIKTSSDYKGFFGKVRKALDDFKDKLKDIKKFFGTWKGRLVIAGSVVGIIAIIYFIFFF